MKTNVSKRIVALLLTLVMVLSLVPVVFAGEVRDVEQDLVGKTVILHTNDTHGALLGFAQVAKVLKPGGCFLICNESDGTDPTSVKFEKIIDGMKNYPAEEIDTALRAAGFSEVVSDHHPSKPWITVLARK